MGAEIGHSAGMEKSDEYMTIEVTATAPPVDFLIKFRDGHTVGVRLGEKTPAGGPYTLEDVESITYATTSPGCVISVGTVGEAKD